MNRGDSSWRWRRAKDGQKTSQIRWQAGPIGRDASDWGSMQVKGAYAGKRMREGFAFSRSCAAVAGKSHGGEFCGHTIRLRWCQEEVRDIYLIWYLADRML